MSVNQCETCSDPTSTCGDCGAKQVLLLEEDYNRLREYIVALERTRADLWGSNEELREKIGALERGTLILQGQWTDKDESAWQEYLKKCRASESNGNP